jgi:hypothetical protein
MFSTRYVVVHDPADYLSIHPVLDGGVCLCRHDLDPKSAVLGVVGFPGRLSKTREIRYRRSLTYRHLIFSSMSQKTASPQEPGTSVNRKS